MLQSYKSKSLLVVDNGLFLSLAVKLSQEFGKVMYYSPWKNDFPKSVDRRVGTGIPNVERVFNLFDHIDEADCLAFLDIYDGDIQTYLEKNNLHKRIWGGRKGEELELLRHDSKQLFKSLGLPVNDYELITGMKDLRKYLKENEDQFVKISITRGDCETFHSPNYQLIEPFLDELEHKLGPCKVDHKFVVEDAINDAVEIGYDGYCIDGEFPGSTVFGLEIKDRGYVCHFKPYDEIPKEVTEFNDAIAPVMKEYGYRGFFSTECRVKKNVSYMTDAATRCGAPPSELYQNMYENLADIIWYGAEGKVVDPICTEKYGAEIMIHSVWNDKNWQTLQYPDKIEDNVKLRKFCIINGEKWVVPQYRGGSDGTAEPGMVVATGKSLEEAVERVKEYAKEVSGYDLDICYDAIDSANEEIEKMNEMGIKF